MDIYLVNSGPSDFYTPKQRSAMRCNKTIATAPSPMSPKKPRVAAGTTFGMGVARPTNNNDGYPDLFVTALWPLDSLSQQRRRTFTDVTEKAGFGRVRLDTSAVWFDYDNDGRLDLFVCSFVDYTTNLRAAPHKAGQRYYCIPRLFKAHPQLLVSQQPATGHSRT